MTLFHVSSNAGAFLIISISLKETFLQDKFMKQLTIMQELDFMINQNEEVTVRMLKNSRTITTKAIFIINTKVTKLLLIR